MKYKLSQNLHDEDQNKFKQRRSSMEILRSPDDNNISYQNISTNKYISNICKDLEKVEDLPNFASQQTFSQ